MKKAIDETLSAAASWQVEYNEAQRHQARDDQKAIRSTLKAK